MQSLIVDLTHLVVAGGTLALQRIQIKCLRDFSLRLEITLMSPLKLAVMHQNGWGGNLDWYNKTEHW